MSEEKHFSYEAEEPVVVSQADESQANESKDLEITDVVFLTPAKIKYVNGDAGQQSIMVGVDLISRKAYAGRDVWVHSDKIFEYLDRVNTLPEDFFEASEDIYEKASEAAAELEEIRKSTKELGEE